MSHSPTILIYGHDATLRDTRRWVLESAGFEVFTASEFAAAKTILADRPVDVLLLCHTLSPDQRQTALADGAMLWPEMRRLIMFTDSQEVEQPKLEGETLHSFAGAEGLIAASRKLTNQKSEG